MPWRLLLLWTALAAPATATDPQVEAELTQVDAPRWLARQAAAEARLRARQGFARGERLLGEAYPDLPPEHLSDPTLLRGRLLLLDDAAITREQARQRADPTGADPRSLEAWRARRDAALQAEAAADEAERALILAVLARLQASPELGRDRPTLPDPLDWPPPTDEPERARREAQAGARHQRWLLWRLDLLTAAIGRPLPDPDEALARLADPAAAADAAERLWLLLPFLRGNEQAAVDSALADWWGDPARAYLTPSDPPPAPPSTLRGAAETIQALRALSAELRSPAAVARDSALQRWAEALLAAAEAAAAREAQASASPPVVDVERVKSQAQEAADQAEAARAAAIDARDRRRADALEAHAAAQRRAAQWAEEAARAAADLSAFRSSLQTELDQLQGKARALAERSSLDPARPDPDQVYRELLASLTRVRERPSASDAEILAAEAMLQAGTASFEEDQAKLEEARALLPELMLPERERFAEALTAWDQALADGQAALTERSRLARSERDLVLSALSRGRQLRRQVERHVSPEAWRADRANFLRDVAQELTFLQPTVALRWRERKAEFLRLGERLLDLNLLVAVLVGSFWGLLTTAAWLVGRGQVGWGASAAVAQVGRWRPELQPVDLARLHDPIERFLRNLADLLVVPVLLWSLADSLPEASLALRLYLYLAWYRASLACFDLLVLPANEARPALFVLPPPSHQLLRGAARDLLSWWMASQLAQHLLWDVLQLDRTSVLIDSAFSLALSLLALSWIYRAEPVFRAALRAAGAETTLTRWLTIEPANPWLRIPRGLGQMVLLSARAAVDLVHLLSQEGTSLAWLFNAFNRYRLTESEGGQPSIDPKLRQTLVEAAAELAPLQPVPTAAFLDAFADWRETNRRGMVALVGDRGMGKSLAVNALLASLAQHPGSADLQVARGRLEGPLRTLPELHRWLGSLVGLPDAPADMDALVDALEATPRRVLVVEGAHLAFARQVGGTALIARLLYLINATCDRHFWLVSFHGPTWDYLSSAASQVDMAVFPTVLRLPPWTSQQLRDLALARAQALGYELDFRGLVRRSALLGSAPGIDRERQTALFFRLLSEASHGAPEVAMHLLGDCLGPGETPHTLRVRPGPSLAAPIAEDLSDAALFTLMAIYLHDQLSEADLLQVANLPVGELRATVRDLLARGWVVWREERLLIPDEPLPMVRRSLRRRHLLHLGVA